MKLLTNTSNQQDELARLSFKLELWLSEPI